MTKLWALSLYTEQESTHQSNHNLRISRRIRYLAGSLTATTAEEAERLAMAWLKENFKESDGWGNHGVSVAVVPDASIIAVAKELPNVE